MASPEEVRALIARGEYLAAFDLARSDGSEGPELAYLAVLALARAGASERAQEELNLLPERLLSGDDPGMAEDVAALRARVLKDRALSAAPSRRRALGAAAASEYEQIYRRLGRYYSCVNAATMWLVAGEDARARQLAGEARALCCRAKDHGRADTYWIAATEAEAAVLLGEVAVARDALARAAEFSADDLSARATTRRQLRLVCALRGVDSAILDLLPVPRVVHYCGHLLGERLPGAEVARVAAEVRRCLIERRVGFAFGSLASGADLIVAEIALELGVELHVVLPFAAGEFCDVSVVAAGDEWVERFSSCLSRAQSVTHATQAEYLGDDVLFDHAARVAMGKAIVRAGFLATEAEQLAVWDGGPGPSAVGTGSDVATWRATGRVTHVVDSGGRSAHTRRRPAGATRVVRALLFADVVGYGRLSESQIRVFVETLLGVVVEILARYESEISLRQRWGDALHLVFTSVSAAAECALDLHEAVRALPLVELGLPDDLSFRIGAHVGPVFSGVDPIEGRATFFGEPVTRAARIEPMTPPGQVFVTDEFAALATLEAGSSVACEYVGHVETSKGYGRFPMYVLKRRGRA